LQGVLYGLTRKGRVLIADEMGVGKTVQALALAACYQVCTAQLQQHRMRFVSCRSAMELISFVHTLAAA
jgi:SNF2 family DNA or RNA helicase